MTGSAIDVYYPFVYDLHYRVKHACLGNEIFRIDFVDWIKAGVAYNTRGLQNPKRKVAYFAELYRIILNRSDISSQSAALQTAVTRFYEDLFQLYQDHLVAQLKHSGKRAKSGNTEPDNLILLPSFEQIPELMSVLEQEQITLLEYDCKNLVEFKQAMATIYAVQGTPIFRCMSLMYDYGICKCGNGVILEVI